ncbi:MAG: phosphatase [Campylobacterota bacterium]|nr:phosphatase [Campylobacterota bacterium]
MIAIDLGSNTLRVVQMDSGTGELLAEYDKIVKTADGLVQSGMINAAAIQRVIVAIREVQTKIDFSSDKLRAVTTEAVRRASNSDEVLSAILEETGIRFEIITGEEEARLTFLAVRNRLEILGLAREESFLLVDIGGGSTELIFHYPHQTISKSFPIGIVTVAQSYHTLEEISEAVPRLMAEMQEFTDEIYAKEGRVDTFVATAGTPTTVAAMKLGQTYAAYDPQQINGMELTTEDLERELHRLLAMPFEERENVVGVGRSDLIAAGILIFRELYVIADIDRCVVIDDGLREGVALEAYKNNQFFGGPIR